MGKSRLRGSRQEAFGKALCLAGLIGLANGCGQPWGEVEGVVSQEGQPLAGIQVIFLPDPRLGGQGSSAWGITDEQGRYHLFTGGERAKCVACAHRVCLRDALFFTKQASQDRIPPAYQDVSGTPLQPVEVKPGKQTLDFNIPVPDEP